MANHEIGTLTEESWKRLKDQFQHLETLVRNLRRQADGDPLSVHVPELYFGITTTNTAYPSYPTGGNTFVVKLSDKYFTESPGTQTVFTKYSSQCVVARTLDGSAVAIDTTVRLERRVSRRGIRWWIVPIRPPVVIASLCGDLCFDSEVTIIANTAYDPETGENVNMTGIDLINPRHHTGRHEDEVELRWDQRRLAYYVIDVERHWIRPLTRIQKHGTDSKGCFTITGPKISVESCEGDLPNEACLLFGWKPCPTGSGTEEDYDCPLTAEPTDIDICSQDTLSSSFDCSSGESSSG